jgi:hypothetical protein
LGIGDWGLGPLPNPQSPFKKNKVKLIKLDNNYLKFKYILKN